MSANICVSQSAVCAYKYRKRITFDPAMVIGSSNLTNFTALINITSDNDLRHTGSSGHVENTNGYDIIFTSEDGVTLLDHQLEKYTSTTGELVAWVRIPNLSTTYNTIIYMYYGATVGGDPSLNTTWSSGYKGVWHFNNNILTDGTSNGNNGTNSGSTNLANAKIAGGRSFAGTGANYLQIPLSGASGGNGNGTVELWGRLTSYSTSTYFFGETTSQTGYANRIQLYIGDGAGNLYLGIGGNHTLQTNIQLMALNTWYHIALTWANTGAGTGTYSIYINGAQSGTGNYSAFTAIHTFADLGNDGNSSQRTEEIPGNIDEVKITNTTLSANWITTEYNNQNSPSTFYTISAEPKVWNGGSNNNFNAAANWLNNAMPSAGDDVIINNGSNQPTLQGNLQLNSLFVRTGATLSLSNRNLSIRSDITNCGTIAGNTGTVTLNSTSVQVQYLSGSGTYNLTDIIVNNTFSLSPQLTLNKDVNVSSDLVLTSGIVNTTATNILALGTGATSTSGSATSFVSGPISKAGNTNFVFPTGKGTKWRRTAVTSISASSTYRAEYFGTAFTSTTPVNSPLNNVSSLEYWQVDRIAGTGNANVSLYWENAGQSVVNNCPDLTIARWNGASWDERAGTTVAGSTCSGTGTGTIITNAVVTAFSPFTFGSKSSGVNPLPISLLEFKATCLADAIVLNWSTASENNNDYFIMQRSEDGSSWIDIEHKKGAGNSSGLREYSMTDNSKSNDLVYYRLMQVDFDGRKEAFDLIAVNCINEYNSMLVYPNPSDSQLNMQFDVNQNYKEVQLIIIDALGKIVFEKSIHLLKGKNNFQFEHNLNAGVYSLLCNGTDLNFAAKKIIIKD